MRQEDLDEEIIGLCDKYNFDHKSLSGNELERKYLLADVTSSLEQEKSKTIVMTVVGVFVAIGLLLTRMFYEIHEVLGIVYFVLVTGVVSLVSFKHVRLYLLNIKGLTKLKELLIIKNSEEKTKNHDITNGSEERLLSKDKRTGKTIGVMHFVYLSIIFAGVVIWLVSYIFADSNYAGSLLAFAATLSSILLAVIAIIITLIDVAGQRSNIFDVKNSVEELKQVTADFNVLQNEYIDNNNVIKGQITDLLNKQQGANELITKLGEVIESSQSTDDGIGTKELSTSLQEIKGLLENQQEKIGYSFKDKHRLAELAGGYSIDWKSRVNSDIEHESILTKELNRFLENNKK